MMDLYSWLGYGITFKTYIVQKSRGHYNLWQLANVERYTIKILKKLFRKH